ncbi:BQ2448_2378 [Microbotryum intermedium]|uniref:BQ2448_2378 protein n=1 Tax=Microbotryum intermedium TaxID=269621 RepID=A0A238FE00_9BASI|nr:BQ2448_2378 [Microbotryum intermedium]
MIWPAYDPGLRGAQLNPSGPSGSVSPYQPAHATPKTVHSSLPAVAHRGTVCPSSCAPQPSHPILHPTLQGPPRVSSQVLPPQQSTSMHEAPTFANGHPKAGLSHEVGPIIGRGGSKTVRLLPPETRDSDLLALGSYWGRVISVRAILSHPPPPYPTRHQALPSNTICKGVGFILYENVHQAMAAISGLRQIGFEASMARDSVNLQLRQLADEGSTNLYLSNLPISFQEADLVHLLRPAQVLSVRLLRQNDVIPASERLSPGPSRGIGFARIAYRNAADEAIERLQGVFLPGSCAPLRVRYADSMGQKELKNRVCLGQTPRAATTSSRLGPTSAESPPASQYPGGPCGSLNAPSCTDPTLASSRASLEAPSAGRPGSTLSPIQEYTDHGSVLSDSNGGRSCISAHAESDESSPPPSPSLPSANTSRTTSPSPSFRSKGGATLPAFSIRPSVLHSRSAPDTVAMIKRCTEVLVSNNESHSRQHVDDGQEIVPASTMSPTPTNLRRSTSSSALH